MPASRLKQPDQGRIVASLAVECDMPVGEMAVLYAHERAALASGAHLTKFLDILTIRNVHEILRLRGLEKLPLVPASPALLAG